MPWRRKPVAWLEYWEGPVNRGAGFKTVLVYCVGPPKGKLCGHCGQIPLQDLPDWESRGHFFGVAAHLMRQILVDHARRRLRAKRGGEAEIVRIEDTVSFAPERGRDIEELDEALTALAAFDERKAKVVELRFFGGFSIEETARALGISTATITREQRMAEAWLHREMTGTKEAGG